MIRINKKQQHAKKTGDFVKRNMVKGSIAVCALTGLALTAIPKVNAANINDNKNVEEEEIHYTSIKNLVMDIADTYEGCVIGDVFDGIGRKYFDRQEEMYTDVVSYSSYASALMDGVTLNGTKVSISDKNIGEEEYEEPVIVTDCVLAKGKTYSVTQEEYDWLTKIVMCEAGGEDYEGMVLVANVILNRLSSSRFPNTIEGVIFENNNGTYQFSPAKHAIYDAKPTSKVKKAVDAALAGDDYSQGATYFIATWCEESSWHARSLTHLFTHNKQSFYKY